MRLTRWVVLMAVSATAACNCGHKGQDQIVSKDATPNATPNPLDFGSVPIGAAVILPLKLSDIGTLPLEIGSAEIVQGDDAGAPQFTFAPLTNMKAPFGASVQAGAEALVNIQFQPTAPGGPQTATLVIKSNSTGLPVYNVVLKGNGISVSIVLQPPTLDFGYVQVGTTSTMSVTLTNQGTSTSDPITVQQVTGTQASDFGWTGTVPTTGLAPNQSFSLQVSFTPAQQGQASALILYQDCASCTPGNILLTGVGVDGQLVYNPSSISFAGVPIGSTVTSGTVTLTNVGTAAVEIQSLALASPSSVFSVTGVTPGPITLQPLGSTTFGVSYTAASSTDAPDSVDASWVPLDTKGNPVAGVLPRVASDPITGNGTLNPCSLTILPPAFNFGNVTVGTAVTKSVTITNTGQQQCAITAVALSSTTDPAFTLVDPSLTSFTLTAGQKQSIAVSCDVTTGGAPLLRKGALTFVSTDTVPSNVTVPLTAYLKGTGPYVNGWPKWHNDNTDQGLSQSDTSANQGAVLWQFRVGVPQTAGGIFGSINPNPTYMNSPVVDEYGNVYQLGMDGTFYGLDPGGNELWTATLLPPNPDEHPATPIIAADDTIYIETGTDGAVLTSAAQLYHIDAASGKILFSASPPTGQTRCGTGGGSGGGGSGGNGCSGADGFDVNPSIGNGGMLFDGDDFGQTVTYTLNSGGTFTQANEVLLPWYGERVAVAIDESDNSYWCCLALCFGVTSPTAGFQLIPAWSASGASLPNSGGLGFANSDLAYDQAHTGWLIVEAGTQTGTSGVTEVVAMDRTNGTLHWDTKLPAGPTPGSMNLLTGAGIFSADVGNAAPAIGTDGTVYVGNVDGLYALNGTTGAINWTYKPSQDTGANADVDTAPAIGGDGTIFFGSAGGTFYAVKPDGTERFHYTTGGRISSSPAIGPDGTVFFVSDDGQLYAIR